MYKHGWMDAWSTKIITMVNITDLCLTKLDPLKPYGLFTMGSLLKEKKKQNKYRKGFKQDCGRHRMTGL